MFILVIETSCDDTACAILEAKKEKKFLKFNTLANVVSSQVKIHKKYGGIVPNLASREHLKNIDIVFNEAIKQAGWQKKDIIKKIDLLTVTSGPGLIPSLLIGVNFIKTLAWVMNKPVIGVNHLKGHLYSFLLPLEKTSNHSLKEINKLFPAISLIVSGGHTTLLLMKNLYDFEIISETRDDAAGECFDKIARLLKLGYPGGPAIAKEALKIQNLIDHNKFNKSEFCKLAPEIKLPRPMINSQSDEFSFSGLKTAVLYLIQKLEKNNNLKTTSNKLFKKYRSLIAWEAQEAITDILVKKAIKTTKNYNAKTIIISGGVSANQRLREKFIQKLKQEKLAINFIAPPIKYTTDNALMIALASFLEYSKNKNKGKTWDKINADANLQLIKNK